MPIQRRLRYVGAFDDLIDSDVANSAGREHRVGRLEQAFTGWSAFALRRDAWLRLGHRCSS